MTTSTISLDADQLEAVQCPSVNILCLAGAGSGKTRTLIERIKDLVRSGESPASMVAITYTNAAAKELSDRLDGIKLGFCGTLHGFVLRLVKAHHDLIGFGQAITILDEDQAADVLDRTCERLKYKGTKKDLKAALANGVNYTPAGRPRTSAELVASSFYRTLQTESAMTFDSILEYGTVILAMAPSESVKSFHVLSHCLSRRSQLARDSGVADRCVLISFPRYPARMLPNHFPYRF